MGRIEEMEGLGVGSVAWKVENVDLYGGRKTNREEGNVTKRGGEGLCQVYGRLVMVGREGQRGRDQRDASAVRNDS